MNLERDPTPGEEAAAPWIAGITGVVLLIGAVWFASQGEGVACFGAGIFGVGLLSAAWFLRAID